MSDKEAMLDIRVFANRVGLGEQRAKQMARAGELEGAYKTDCCKRWRVPERHADMAIMGEPAIGATEYALRIGASRQTVMMMLREGLVPGAKRFGQRGHWRIPVSATSMFAPRAPEEPTIVAKAADLQRVTELLP